MNEVKASIVIPTYNRYHSIRYTLRSLRWQTLPSTQFEVIVVDDGSTDETHLIQQEAYPFHFQYVRQKNQGATLARNAGFHRSNGDILVFMDDDVTISPTTLEVLIATLGCRTRTLATGTLILRNAQEIPQTTEALLIGWAHEHGTKADSYLNFVACNTELLAIRRTDFQALEMFQDPTSGRGWPNWDDVDFGYRAHLHGYKLLCCAGIVGVHWDYSLADVISEARRWQRLAHSGVALFQSHPQLQEHIPMFSDKLPIAWGKDSPGLIVRKLLRPLASAPPLLTLMARFVEMAGVNPSLARMIKPLHRWIIGGYIYRGYREGLQRFGPLPRQREHRLHEFTGSSRHSY